jgi:hypothetical protein
MADSKKQGGCGCCGFIFFGLLFLLIALIGAGLYFYFSSANNLRRYASSEPAALPPAESSPQLYAPARQRFDQFFSSPSQQSLTLSGPELNALLTQAPELKCLQKGVVATLHENSAELNCSVPVNLPFFSGRYFNYTLYLRPSLRGEDIELQVFRIDREGKQLGSNELRDFRISVEHSADLMLSGLNKMQLDRSIRDIRIENGNLIISR